MRREALLKSLAVALSLAVVLLAQAFAPASLPASDLPARAGDSVGRAGFAYLTGFRMFAAAVLWNRLEPQFHEYYDARAIEEQTQMLPVIRIVTALDPQFTQPYFVAPWILARRGDVEGGLALAREGVSNNPRSGVLIASYAQLIAVFTGDLERALAEGERILEPDTEWASLPEQHDAYAILRGIYIQAGDTDAAERVSIEIARIDLEMDRLGIFDDHDHDH